MLDQTKQYWKNTLKSFEDSTENHTFDSSYLKNEVEYLKPVLLHHQPFVQVFLENIGTKSFTLSYELKVDGALCSRGSSVLVCFDSSKNETIPIPEVMSKALLQLKKEQ